MSTVWILSNQKEDEYETSRLLEKFHAKNITVEIVNPDFFDIVVNRDIKQGVRYQGKTVELPRVLLVRFGAGISNFMLTLIRQLVRVMEQPVVGSGLVLLLISRPHLSESQRGCVHLVAGLEFRRSWALS